MKTGKPSWKVPFAKGLKEGRGWFSAATRGKAFWDQKERKQEEAGWWEQRGGCRVKRKSGQRGQARRAGAGKPPAVAASARTESGGSADPMGGVLGDSQGA